MAWRRTAVISPLAFAMLDNVTKACKCRLDGWLSLAFNWCIGEPAPAIGLQVGIELAGLVWRLKKRACARALRRLKVVESKDEHLHLSSLGIRATPVQA